MIEAINTFINENGKTAIMAAVAVIILLAVILVVKKVRDGKNKQRAIFSNSKNKYKSRLGKKNINKYIYKQGKKK